MYVSISGTLLSLTASQLSTNRYIQADTAALLVLISSVLFLKRDLVLKRDLGKNRAFRRQPELVA